MKKLADPAAIKRALTTLYRTAIMECKDGGYAICLNGKAHDYQTLYKLPGMKNGKRCRVCGAKGNGDEL